MGLDNFFHQTANGPIKWPTKRWRQFAEANGLTSISAITTFVNNNLPAGSAAPAAGGLTTAQASALRQFIREIIICIVQVCNNGEAPPEQD